MRFAAIKNNRIFLVSDQPFIKNDIQTIEIPDELNHLTPQQLISSCRYHDGQLTSKLIKKTASQLKIALVGNWAQKCGISTYASFLWPEITKHVQDFKLFIEYNNNPIIDQHQYGNQMLSDDKIIQCWKRGESLISLINAIKEYNPDIVLINHEYGIWPNACYWLSMMNQLSDFRIITILHSVFHHSDKTIVEAAIPEIVVHLQGAKDVLKKEKEIPGNVYVIPHGCFPCLNKDKLWNFYKTPHTIIQSGFLFRYKGWQDAIKAIALLKNKYSDIFFTGLCSESDHNKTEHQLYYNELMELVEQLNLQENVALIRGYQSDQTLNSYFRTNQVGLLPYISGGEHEVFGVSGIARLMMTKGLLLVTSASNHFSDLDTIKTRSPEEIASAIEKVFEDKNFAEAQVDKQVKYLEENSWNKVALQYIKLFENEKLS